MFSERDKSCDKQEQGYPLNKLIIQYYQTIHRALHEKTKTKNLMKEVIINALKQIDIHEESEIDINEEVITIEIHLINYLSLSELNKLIHTLEIKEDDIKLDARENTVIIIIPLY